MTDLRGIRVKEKDPCDPVKEPEKIQTVPRYTESRSDFTYILCPDLCFFSVRVRK